MITLAFFFLLRPSEYTATGSDTSPFTLADVQLFHVSVRLNLQQALECKINHSTFDTLEFTTRTKRCTRRGSRFEPQWRLPLASCQSLDQPHLTTPLVR